MNILKRMTGLVRDVQSRFGIIVFLKHCSQAEQKWEKNFIIIYVIKFYVLALYQEIKLREVNIKPFCVVNVSSSVTSAW